MIICEFDMKPLQFKMLSSTAISHLFLIRAQSNLRLKKLRLIVCLILDKHFTNDS